jgi:hypothetical protein
MQYYIIVDFISIYLLYLLVLPGGWCRENIAKLLKLCGGAICLEFFGSKAINGRTQELAFLVFYTFQVSVDTCAF